MRRDVATAAREIQVPVVSSKSPSVYPIGVHASAGMAAIVALTLGSRDLGVQEDGDGHVGPGVDCGVDGGPAKERGLCRGPGYADSLLLQQFSCVERVTGIEPALSAWELLEVSHVCLARCGFSGHERPGASLGRRWQWHANGTLRPRDRAGAPRGRPATDLDRWASGTSGSLSCVVEETDRTGPWLGCTMLDMSLILVNISPR